MEYNKKDFTKANDKKVLHKIRKHWVVVSTALLMALGGGAVATTHASANADSTNGNNGTTTKANAVKEQLNQKLQQPQQSQQSTQAQSGNNNQNQAAQTNPKAITTQAAALHNSILGNAAKRSAQQSQQSNAPTQQPAQSQTPKANNQGVNAPKSGNPLASDKAQTPKVNLGLTRGNQANANNNQVDLNQNRPKQLLGASGDSTPTPGATGRKTGTIPSTATPSPSNLISDNSTGKNISYVPFSDAGFKSDAGAISVLYRNPNNNLIVTNTQRQEAEDGTPFTSSDMQNALTNVPGNGNYELAISSGHPQSDAIYKGAGTTKFESGRDQYIIINVQPVPKKGDGQILVQYLDDTTKDKNGHYKVLVRHLQSDANGTSFNQDGFYNNPPQGYSADSFDVNASDYKGPGQNDGTKITKFEGQPSDQVGTKTLNIFVEPTSHLTTATVNYVDVNNGNSIVNSRQIQGQYNVQGVSSDIPLSTYDNLIPSGYVYAGSNTNVVGNGKFTPNGASVVNIGVKKGNPVPNPTPLSDATTTIHYRTSDNGNDLNTITVTGNQKSDVSTDQSTINDAVPDGYTLNSGQNVTGKFGNPTSEVMLVTAKPGYKKQPVTSDTVQYDYLSDGKLTQVPNTTPITLDGYPGTPIDYAPYIQDVPSGYVYTGYMPFANSKMESYEKNIILVQSVNSLTQPIYVHFIDEAGDDITPKDANKSDDPSYKITGTYNQKITISDILKHNNNATNMPTGYSLNNAINPSDQAYYISNRAQTANVFVKGSTITASPSTPSDVLTIQQNIYDPKGNFITSYKVDTEAIGGSDGSVTTLNANNYMPAPTADYSIKNPSVQKTDAHYASDVKKNYNQQVKLVADYNPNNTVKSYHLETMSDKPVSNNTITFDYTQNTATANVAYKYNANGQIVGSTTVSGQPNTPMSDFYKSNGNTEGLNDTPPYGYKASSDQSDETDQKLVNGATYTIDVDNAYEQPQNTTNDTRKGYGYITVNYGSDLSDTSNDGKRKVYSSMVVSGPVNNTFYDDPYKTTVGTSTSHGNGVMPTFYSNPKLTSGETSDEQFSKTPGTYNIDVTLDDKSKDYNVPTSDTIDYVPVTISKDGSWTSDDNHIKQVKIYGMTGHAINYVPYQQDVPSGYAYKGMNAYSSQYVKGLDPIARIYIATAAQATTNTNSDYDPNAADKNQNGTQTKPYNPFDNNGNAHLYPGQNHHHTLPTPSNTGYPSGDNAINQHTDNGNGGSDGTNIPTGYTPALVPSDAKNPSGSKYIPGFVPSDGVPAGYVPGYVPAGKGQNGHETYIPGYVPGDRSKLPKNPKYVPGEVPDGKWTPEIDPSTGKPKKDVNGHTIYHEGTVPGFVPDISPYAPGESAAVNIQYINSNEPSDVIQTITANGSIGKTLAFNGVPSNANNKSDYINGSDYTKDVPAGYANPQILGLITKDKPDTQLKNNDFTYSDASVTPTIQIGVDQAAAGNINYIYVDKNGASHIVGSTQINGYEGEAENLTPYTNLLPYNYTNDTSRNNGNLNVTLHNGSTYPIYVDKGNLMPQLPPKPLNGQGYAIVNYMNGNTVVGSQQFAGPIDNKTHIINQSDETNLQNGDVPYGYKLSKSFSQGDFYNFANNNFTSTVQTYDIPVTPTQETGVQPETDEIAYDEVVSQGYGKSDKLVPVKDKNGNLITTKVSGNDGDAINYTPYQNSVPYGYSYDGMGTHGNLIDSVHTGTNGKYDIILVRKAREAPKQTTITVHYVTNSEDNPNGQTVKVDGIQGHFFNLSYYQNNVPANLASEHYVYENMPDRDNNIIQFTGNNQDVFINLKENEVQRYGTVKIHFVDANKLNPNSTPTQTQLSDAEFDKSNVEQTTGAYNHIFNPQSYEYNVPVGTKFAYIASGNNITDYQKKDQDMYIAVDVNPSHKSGNGDSGSQPNQPSSGN